MNKHFFVHCVQHKGYCSSKPSGLSRFKLFCSQHCCPLTDELADYIAILTSAVVGRNAKHEPVHLTETFLNKASDLSIQCLNDGDILLQLMSADKQTLNVFVEMRWVCKVCLYMRNKQWRGGWLDHCLSLTSTQSHLPYLATLAWVFPCATMFCLLSHTQRPCVCALYRMLRKELIQHTNSK